MRCLSCGGDLAFVREKLGPLAQSQPNAPCNGWLWRVAHMSATVLIQTQETRYNNNALCSSSPFLRVTRVNLHGLLGEITRVNWYQRTIPTPQVITQQQLTLESRVSDRRGCYHTVCGSQFLLFGPTQKLDPCDPRTRHNSSAEMERLSHPHTFNSLVIRVQTSAECHPEGSCGRQPLCSSCCCYRRMFRCRQPMHPPFGAPTAAMPRRRCRCLRCLSTGHSLTL